MSARVVTIGGGHSWETRFVAELPRTEVAVTVVRRCADIVEVLAIASTGQCDVALVAADTRGLDTDTVVHLADMRVAVVGVIPHGDTQAEDRLRRIGIGWVVDEAIDAVELAAVVEQGSQRVRTGPPVRIDETGVQLSPPAWSNPQPSSSAAAHLRQAARPIAQGGQAGPPAAGELLRPGRIVAVWGPHGAPGRTTVALGLADRIAARGSTVCLIDADVYGGVIAHALGLLDESAGLAGACRLAAHGRLDAAALAAACWRIGERIRVLTGIGRADRWPEIRPTALPAVLGYAAELVDWVIVDCSALLETDEEISFDTLAPRRNGATIAAIESADTVVAVGSADPPGLQRLAGGLEALLPLTRVDTLLLALNKVRATAASPSELSQAALRFCGIAPSAFLPEDRAATDKAWRHASMIAERSPKSPLVRELAKLADQLLAAPREVSSATDLRAPHPHAVQFTASS